MEFSLERVQQRSGRPVYRQIADEIRRTIESGGLAAGERLPPIRDLARRLGVNRDTVAQAYEELAASGTVQSSVGRGTFVACRPGAPQATAFHPRFAPTAERLLAFERARPRFGTAEVRVRSSLTGGPASAPRRAPCRCTPSFPIPPSIRPTGSAGP